MLYSHYEREKAGEEGTPAIKPTNDGDQKELERLQGSMDAWVRQHEEHFGVPTESAADAWMDSNPEDARTLLALRKKLLNN